MNDIILISSAVIIVGAFLAAAITYYEYRGFGSQVGIIRRGSTDMPVVSITFDDGPSPIYTPKVLDILKTQNVKATFFLTGKHVKKYPGVAKRIVREGHEVGNHTYNHRDLVPVTRGIVEREATKTEKVFWDILGIKTSLFRPPRGLYSNRVRQILVDEMGYDIVLWSISSIDWRGISPHKIVSRIKRYLRNGAIILFHDSGSILKKEGGKRSNTVKSLPLVIEMLRCEGFSIVPVGELIKQREAEKRYLDTATEEA